MAFISLFDVIGPNMVGPSSSHTAGAASMALLARRLFPGRIKKVRFTLYGSFAQTYRGHGTDRALLGGIMGFQTDDLRIRDSLTLAREQGLCYEFITSSEREMNTRILRIWIWRAPAESIFLCVVFPWAAAR